MIITGSLVVFGLGYGFWSYRYGESAVLLVASAVAGVMVGLAFDSWRRRRRLAWIVAAMTVEPTAHSAATQRSVQGDRPAPDETPWRKL